MRTFLILLLIVGLVFVFKSLLTGLLPMVSLILAVMLVYRFLH